MFVKHRTTLEPRVSIDQVQKLAKVNEIRYRPSRYHVRIDLGLTEYLFVKFG
jgi:hypothetical protein